VGVGMGMGMGLGMVLVLGLGMGMVLLWGRFIPVHGRGVGLKGDGGAGGPGSSSGRPVAVAVTEKGPRAACGEEGTGKGARSG
jgi:hypothetical protein